MQILFIQLQNRFFRGLNAILFGFNHSFALTSDLLIVIDLQMLMSVPCLVFVELESVETFLGPTSVFVMRGIEEIHLEDVTVGLSFVVFQYTLRMWFYSCFELKAHRRILCNVSFLSR